MGFNGWPQDMMADACGREGVWREATGVGRGRVKGRQKKRGGVKGGTREEGGGIELWDDRRGLQTNQRHSFSFPLQPNAPPPNIKELSIQQPQKWLTTNTT